jgi:phage repressor protein C with HTH and peptisase S24 domain
MSFGQVIRRRREEKDLTQDHVSSRVGISKPYLSNIENDKVKNPPSDRVLTKLERVLAFALGELKNLAHQIRTPLDVRQAHERQQAEVERLRQLVRKLMDQNKSHRLPRGARAATENISELVSAGRLVPVINRVSAGYPHEFTDLDYPASFADEYVRCPDVHDPQAFACRVSGDSMAPKYVEGDIVIFAPNLEARPGDECLARFARDNSTTFKRYRPGKGGNIRLEPLNSKYPAETYDPEAITGLWPAVMRIQKLR